MTSLFKKITTNTSVQSSKKEPTSQLVASLEAGSSSSADNPNFQSAVSELEAIFLDDDNDHEDEYEDENNNEENGVDDVKRIHEVDVVVMRKNSTGSHHSEKVTQPQDMLIEIGNATNTSQLRINNNTSSSSAINKLNGTSASSSSSSNGSATIASTNTNNNINNNNNSNNNPSLNSNSSTSGYATSASGRSTPFTSQQQQQQQQADNIDAMVNGKVTSINQRLMDDLMMLNSAVGGNANASASNTNGILHNVNQQQLNNQFDLISSYFSNG